MLPHQHSSQHVTCPSSVSLLQVKGRWLGHSRGQSPVRNARTAFESDWTYLASDTANRKVALVGSSTGSWDIDAAHLDGCSSPTSQMAATHISSRQQSATTTGSHDVQDASEGIELRPTKTNVLLGQYHMERSGQFVSAKPGLIMSQNRQHNSKRDEWHLVDRGPSSRLRV
ncbi:hypothetical protein WJX82_003862 [Trebouxia sp. C0006]